MEKEELVQAVEAMIFASGKAISAKVMAEILEVETDEVEAAATELRQRLVERNSGIQLIQVNGAYQLATLEKFYSYICKMLDNRPKPSLSQAALEVLSIVAYNQCTTRAEIEKIRGVSSDSALNKLLEYNLVEEAGKMNAPGRPMMYKTTEDFLKMFGYTSLKDLPELPEIKEIMAEAEGQITIDNVEQN
ncbi:MAG: SMC-Scp complex subunit ScpB [Clostridia bacterium]|nr:SMC-Scp complex subunit ScpB [Clostridia bacterium]